MSNQVLFSPLGLEDIKELMSVRFCLLNTLTPSEWIPTRTSLAGIRADAWYIFYVFYKKSKGQSVDSSHALLDMVFVSDCLQFLILFLCFLFLAFITQFFQFPIGHGPQYNGALVHIIFIVQTRVF